MQALFTAGKTDNSSPPGRQIRDRVRDLIVSGKLTPGQKVPSTRQLATMWNTHVPTVHAALTSLVKEGLLVRVHGSGTFVRKRANRLTSVGIYNSASAMTDIHSAFLRAVYAELHAIIRAASIDLTVWLDPRPQEEQSSPWEPALSAAHRGEIQGAIMLAADPPHLQWFTGLPVATSYLGAVEPTSVEFNERQLAELGLRCLAEQGCESVGLISVYHPGHRDFYSHFSDVARALSLEVRNEWVRVPEADCRGEMQERFGYRAFRELWRQHSLPRGLMVTPDAAARGTITGLLEEGVRVPEELKLVLHRNLEVDLICPMPATFVDASCREVAQALFEQLQRKFRGESCAPIRVPFRIRPPTRQRKSTK